MMERTNIWYCWPETKKGRTGGRLTQKCTPTERERRDRPDLLELLGGGRRSRSGIREIRRGGRGEMKNKNETERRGTQSFSTTNDKR